MTPQSTDRCWLAATLGRSWATSAILLVSALLLLWRLGAHDLWAPDEPYFAEGAREMLEDGHWLVPHINGELDDHKPPLFFWTIAATGWALFGSVNEMAARLPSALAALLSVWLTIRLGARLQGPETGRLGGLVLVTMHMFWDKGRWAQIDSLLSVLVLGALTLFERARSDPEPNRSRALGFWALLALGVLAKGPIAPVLVLGVAAVVSAWDRDWSPMRRLVPATGPILFFGIVGLWAALATLLVDGYSALAAAGEHFVGRAIRGMHHPQPPWYYLGVLPYALLPWSFLVPGALLFAWRRRSSASHRLLLAWVVFTVALFSISTEKRDLYILPALPAAALLIASLLWSSLVGRADRVVSGRWVTAAHGVLTATLGVLAVLAPLVARRSFPQYVTAADLLALVLGTSTIALLVGVLRSAIGWSTVTTAACGAAVYLTLVTWLYPLIDAERGNRELARAVTAAVAAPGANGELLGVELGYIPRVVNFYGDGLYLDLIDDPLEAIERIRREPGTRLLIDDRALDRARKSLQDDSDLTVLHRARVSRRDLSLIRSGS